MPTLANSLVLYRRTYAPPPPGYTPARELGRAFQRAWHDRSERASRELREAIAALV